MKRLARVTKDLTPRMKQIVQYMFEHPSAEQKEIAKVMGLSTSRISQILRSNRVLEAFPTIARSKLKGMVPKAVSRYGELLSQHDNPEVSRKVASELLHDQKVLGAPEQIVKHQVELMPLTDLVARVRDAQRVTGDVIETEIVDEEV